VFEQAVRTATKLQFKAQRELNAKHRASVFDWQMYSKREDKALQSKGKWDKAGARRDLALANRVDQAKRRDEHSKKAAEEKKRIDDARFREQLRARRKMVS
jgi:hypothetical protein